MAQVVDASLAVAWRVQSQASPLSHAVLAAVADSGGHVPPQFWFEVLHSVARSERRAFVQRATVDQFLLVLSKLPIVVDRAYEPAEMIDLNKLARHYALSIYDASYLELALRLSLPLATRDASLVRAANATGVALFSPD